MKIFGEEGGSFGNSLRELPNGDLLILGATDLTTFGTNFSDGFEEADVDVRGAPSITRTDRFGNVLLTRAFPMESIFLAGLGEFFEFETAGNMADALPLSGGNFMVLGRTGQPVQFAPSFPFFMILDPDFNILELSIHGDQPGILANRVARFGGSLHQLPDGNIGILFGLSIGPPFDRFTFSMLKITPQGDTLWSKEFPESQPTLFYDQAPHLTFDTNGDIITVGQHEQFYLNFLDTCGMIGDTDAFIDERFVSVMRIDQDGNQLDRKLFGPPCEFNRGHFIVPLNPGFALIKRFTRFETEQLFFSLGIIILDQNLEEITTFEVESDINPVGNLQVDRTRDGGFVVTTLIQSQPSVDGESVLFKINGQGQELWRHYFQGTANDVLESQDGGIVVLINKTFNSVTTKATILKLSANGQI